MTVKILKLRHLINDLDLSDSINTDLINKIFASSDEVFDDLVPSHEKFIKIEEATDKTARILRLEHLIYSLDPSSSINTDLINEIFKSSHEVFRDLVQSHEESN